MTDGFTGAEIEQAIVAARYASESKNKSTTSFVDIASSVEATIPISVTRAEDIAALRHWASSRAVPAN